MKIKLAFTLLFFCLVASLANAQNSDARIIVNADQGKYQINKHIYGHFSEHLGRCIYGGIYVGEDNKVIPHTDGVRNDIIEALHELSFPNLRWPGGCFADTYHWKDGVGPKNERPSLVNRWWGGETEDNSFGTHDFLNMCKLLDAEPYLSANVGSGTVQELIDWVQYTNHDGKSEMADWRRANGQEKAWNVKYWGIGNETWGCGGNMTAEYYADVYRQYATFLPGWGGGTEVYRIASGASGDNYHWTEVLMKNVPTSLMEAVALHHYAVIEWGDFGSKGPSVSFDERQYFIVMKNALVMEELVTKHINIMDKYDPEKKVDLFVDEWGGWYDTEKELQNGVLFQQNTMRDAMIAGTTLNTFNNHADRVKMANIAQVVNVLQAVILTDEEKMLLTPTYHVMRMYKTHQDATLLPTFVDTDATYTFGEESLPALSVSSSQAKDGKVHISLVNVDASKSYSIDLDVRGGEFKNATAEILASSKLQDHNTFDNPNKITPKEFKDFSFKKGKLTLDIPAFSVVVFEIN